MKTVNRLVCFFIITVIILIATPAFAERLKYTGLAYLTQYSGYETAFCPPAFGCLFETALGAALNINLSGAIDVGGFITYYEEV